MDKYLKLASKILDNVATNHGEKTIEISTEDAMRIYFALLGMSRVLRIAESDKAGSDIFICADAE